MKLKHLTIAITAALALGISGFDAVAGKGGAGGGMSGMGMGGGGPGAGGGMSKGAGSGGGMKDVPGMGSTTGAGQGKSKGKAAETPFVERHRVGEKDDVGVRTREADQAQ